MPSFPEVLAHRAGWPIVCGAEASSHVYRGPPAVAVSGSPGVARPRGSWSGRFRAQIYHLRAIGRTVVWRWPGGPLLITRRSLHLVPPDGDALRRPPGLWHGLTLVLVEASIARVARRLRARHLLVDRPARNHRGGVCRPGASLRPVPRARPRRPVPADPGPPARRAHDRQHPARAVQPGLAVRQHPRPRADRRRGPLGSIRCIALLQPDRASIGPPWPAGFPRSFWLAEMLFSVAVWAGSGSRSGPPRTGLPVGPAPVDADPHRTLLYGAGRTGVLMARSARREPERRRRAGRVPRRRPYLAGGWWPACASSAARHAAEGGRADRRADPPDHDAQRPGPGGPARRRGGDGPRPRGPHRPVYHRSPRRQRRRLSLRRVQVEDLLRRPIVTRACRRGREIITDQVVLITGAAGSIGSELARQVFAIGPRRLILVDRAESPLYLIQRELEVRREHGQGSGELDFRLANVASRAAMDRLIAAERPSVIFHAAAYKHVPMMEAASVRRDPGQRRRHAGPCSTPRWRRASSGSSSCRPTRRSVHRASWAPASASPRCSSPTRPGAPGRPTSRSASATCWARPAASCRSSRTSSRTAGR